MGDDPYAALRRIVREEIEADKNREARDGFEDAKRMMAEVTSPEECLAAARQVLGVLNGRS
jgi:hypothetical protein